MPEGEGNQQTQGQTQRSNRGGSRGGHRRGRGGRGRGNGARGGRNAPSQRDALESTPAASTESVPTPGASDAPRGRRNRRGQPRGAHSSEARGSIQTGPQRRFGGHLTSHANEATSSPASQPPNLSAQAPEFIPGEAITPRRPHHTSQTQNTPRQENNPQIGPNPPSRSRPRRRQRKPRTEVPKSTLPEIWQRIHEDVANSNYECRICTEDVNRKSEIWSCSICWSVVHLDCSREWFDASQARLEDGSVVWRCPACNSQIMEEPDYYTCWCKKEISPNQTGTLLPPHSCGQTCSKSRSTCLHPCPLQCHAGPCPPCDVMNPSEPCYCGKQAKNVHCKDTDLNNGWSCKETCGDFLACGEHTCEELCHPGVCSPCSVILKTKCYCGNVEKEMPCFERFEGTEPEQSYSLADEDWFTGYFSCGSTCDRPYDCGLHQCKTSCHPQDEPPAHCPFAPDAATTCPCGKTPLDQLLDHPRQNCEDAIPNCTKSCEKLLPCGHSCAADCHAGDCPSCGQVVDIACRCGRHSFKSVCFPGEMKRPWCMKLCQATLNCGRHRCGEHCCPGEKKAQLRVAQQKKHRKALDPLPVEDEHICNQICGRPLTCGNHFCDKICHRGPCSSCPEAVWTEISCNCGDTVLEPGQPCGTRPPYCTSRCRRQPACGHAVVPHNCHLDDEECPPCPHLTAKPCHCGKETLPWVPCHVKQPHCGQACGRKLKCGLHNCRQTCHRTDECRDNEKACLQICGRNKTYCDHTCQNICHSGIPCNETTACQAKKTISCPCGNIKKEIKCLAASSNPFPHQSLSCNDECARLERNRRLAEALNINPETHTDDHIPYSDGTLKLYQEMKAFGDNREREYRVLCQDDDEVRQRYEPMRNSTRQFLHLLAEDFGLKSQSDDYGDDRHVVVWKPTPNVIPPRKTLAQCIEIKAKKAAEAAVIAAIAPPRAVSPGMEPFNGFVLNGPRFGITIEEVSAALQADFSTLPSFTFKVEYMTDSDEVLILATARFSAFLTPVEKSLINLKPRLETTIRRENIADNVLLCHTDHSGAITRRENLRLPGAGGWSAVAGKAARSSPVPVEDKPVGRRLLGLKKKKAPEPGKVWNALEGDVEC